MFGDFGKTKHRHSYLHNYQKEECYEGIRLTNSRVDGSMMACNREYIAVVLQTSGGGVFSVLKTDHPGRYDTLNKFVGHTNPITDLSFSMMQVDRIVSCDENGMFLFWQIQEPIPEEVNEVIGSMQFSTRRAIQSIWHPYIHDAAFLATQDTIVLAECVNFTVLHQYKLPDGMDSINFFTFSQDCGKMAICTKDKNVTVLSTIDDSLITRFQPHEGTKSVRCAFHPVLADKYMLTTGGTKTSERQLMLWDLDNLSAPMECHAIDCGVSLLQIYCDELGIVLLCSKGDVSIKLFEITKDPIKLHDIGSKPLKEAGAAYCFSNKLTCNIKINEIIRGYKCSAKYILETLSIVAARKANTFQSDLYPDTPGEESAMTIEEFVSGNRCLPKTISIKSLAGSCDKDKVAGMLSKTLSSSVKRVVATKSVSSIGSGDSDPLKDIETLKQTVAMLVKDMSDIKAKLGV